jgi:hypothetical protein
VSPSPSHARAASKHASASAAFNVEDYEAQTEDKLRKLNVRS